MRRKSPGPDEFVPSTTRAVAWGALFFSLLAFLTSIATLFLTWHDGQLVKNSRMLLEGLDKTISNWESTRKTADVTKASGEKEKAEPVRWERIRDKVDQLQVMVTTGDDRARYYLDNLVEELGPLRDYTSETTSQWVGQAVDTLRETRDQIRENAPEAARRLKSLSDRLRDQPGQLTGPATIDGENDNTQSQDDLLDLDLGIDNDKP